MKFLLYGANGYTGKLITRLAKEYNVEPILAGRNKNSIEALAKEFNYSYRIFDLSDVNFIEEQIKDVQVVLHTAGPFIYTAQPMMEACINSGVHYLDITGEIDVFEMGHRYDEKAKQAKIMLMSGTGFDVVPTDCTAAYLKKQLPDATELKLAFANIGGSVSHGTATTMVENLGKPGAMRKNGKIIDVPVGHNTMNLSFEGKKIFTMTIPWGDVSTAYYTTGIPNIETYVSIPPSSYKFIKLQKYFNWLMKTNLVKNTLKKRINNRPAGPSDEQRSKAKTLVYGQVKNAKGEIREAQLITPEGYTLTAMASLIITQKVLNGNAPIGFQTPARAYGENLVMEIDGVIREDIT